MAVVLGPYPLCPACQKVNGGLVAVRHRQVHLRAQGRQACVDQGLAGLIAHLWTVCETRSCCENDNGRAYVVPSPDTREAARGLLTRLGLSVTDRDGVLCFPVPRSFHLHDADHVRRVLDQPHGRTVRWQAGQDGRFELR